MFLMQISALPGANDKVRKIYRCAFPDIPFEIEPVTPLDPVFPVSEKQCMHLAGKQVRQAETFDIEGEWLQKKLFFSYEPQWRLCIDLEIDLDGFISMNGKTEQAGIAFQKRRLDPGSGCFFWLIFQHRVPKLKTLS